jgi:hypothetical protein
MNYMDYDLLLIKFYLRKFNEFINLILNNIILIIQITKFDWKRNYYKMMIFFTQILQYLLTISNHNKIVLWYIL